jgi:transposase
MAGRVEIEWQDSVESLKKRYQAEKDVQKRRRLHALWLVRQNRTLSEVCEIIGVHYRTMQEWISWYRQGGIEEVVAHRHGGHSAQERRLSVEQEGELKRKADAGEIRSIADGVKWAQESQQVTYTYWGMRHVFHRLQLKLKVPRPRNPQASADEQEAWKKGGSAHN